MKKSKFDRILIANRGEIALRIISAVQQLGKIAVAIYSETDKDLPYVKAADVKLPLGSGTLHDTYLDQEKIVSLAKQHGASAIHPGYGFLSEDAPFAALCKKNNIAFIGPSSAIIESMGNKANARETAKKLGIPLLEGVQGSKDELLEQKNSLPYPILLKPAAGGGGKGMYIVHSASDLPGAIEDSSREAKNYFGSDALYAERYIAHARHIEVQLMADHGGNIVHLFDRECSIQRRYQKIIEEAPSPSISQNTRKKITDSAVQLAKGIGYLNAGTVEFLMDDAENFFFIEMNTRIQVEHPVSELITGIDLIQEQIRVAEGQALSIKQEHIKISGHAIEARVYAEDPKEDFMPSTGKIKVLDSRDVDARIDAGFESGNEVSSHYDPMIAKIISHALTRSEAREKLRTALEKYHISGIKTNREFLYSLLGAEAFIQNDLHTRYVDEALELSKDLMDNSDIGIPHENILACMAAVSLGHAIKNPDNPWKELGHWRIRPEISMVFQGKTRRISYKRWEPGKFTFQMDGQEYQTDLISRGNDNYTFSVNNMQIDAWCLTYQSEVLFDYKSKIFTSRRTDIADERFIRDVDDSSSEKEQKKIKAPLNGKVVKINTLKGAYVKKGDTLLVIESMKMENKILSPGDAKVKEVLIEMSDRVESNQVLITLR